MLLNDFTFLLHFEKLPPASVPPPITIQYGKKIKKIEMFTLSTLACKFSSLYTTVTGSDSLNNVKGGDGEKEKEKKKLLEKLKGKQTQFIETEPATPATPPEQTPNEEEVVNLIQNWRLKDKEVASDASDSELGFDKLERENSVPLKWDNIKTEEIELKLVELKDIFNQTSNEMEWEKINLQAVQDILQEHNLDGLENFRVWAMEKNNFFHVGNTIISLVEQNKIMEKYTTLNDNFTKRLKDENRYKNDNEIGEKRVALESPSRESVDLSSPEGKLNWGEKVKEINKSGSISPSTSKAQAQETVNDGQRTMGGMKRRRTIEERNKLVTTKVTQLKSRVYTLKK
ncbi:hypothetical protein GLOIN_2v1771953 [Rhizophagus irregularis DAOM 181602=DAOM 197198]|uniref:Uncharacterized protein n=2 Tax=Rhizophagus irregularis TaxID=588596 RepID=A0A2P4Q8L2_RHIID|nr:hypothetical protein GLOIN_2v1771953 [Rhizophagus irregularis DAOM 181602=DAOM 197198]POG73962.1 hypothetical protein GLOIN_2v1771953 [Rhizophagus irregularis DAOM 181602=DAOM 197198]|eukprot:XP_025180828.1 hypothetical protein GLOIN_2v1771953 [Rhizophagus irregularis DAOM 181602=DAOM 197198]